MGIMRPKKFVQCENTLILILNKLEKIKIPAKNFSITFLYRQKAVRL